MAVVEEGNESNVSATSTGRTTGERDQTDDSTSTVGDDVDTSQDILWSDNDSISTLQVPRDSLTATGIHPAPSDDHEEANVGWGRYDGGLEQASEEDSAGMGT